MTDKEYYETRAIELLEEFFGLQNFINLDKPDLQNTIDDIGVEVRRAIDSEDGKREGYVNENFTSGKTIEEKKEQLEKRKVQASVIDLGFAHVLIPKTSSDSSYIKDGYNKIVDSFFDKLRKLNGGGYQHFTTNALFLFCEHANEDWEIRSITKDINDKLKSNSCSSYKLFDIVFFDTSQHLHKVQYDKVKNIYMLSETKDKPSPDVTT